VWEKTAIRPSKEEMEVLHLSCPGVDDVRISGIETFQIERRKRFSGGTPGRGPRRFHDAGPDESVRFADHE
jgi:hypothetical protein